MQMIQDVKSDFFQTLLQAGGDVAFAISERRALLSRWAKHSTEFIREDSTDDWRAIVPTHLHAVGMMTKEIKIETKLATAASPTPVSRPDDVAKLFHETRLTIGRESHDFPFIAVMRKSQKLRRRGIENSG